MARLVPNTDPSLIELEPERKVAEALCAQFPNNVIVFHSYPWLRPERDLYKPGSPHVLREGEADFVIVHPLYGLAVLEVKGGHMRFDPATQIWSRAGARHPVKDPFTQASANMRALEKQIRERHFAEHLDLPFCRVRAVVFPHCDYMGTMPKGAAECVLFGASDLGNLGKKIEDLFRLQPFVPKGGLSRDTMDGITRGLTSTFKLVPALWSEIADQERHLFRFTEEQLNILKVLQSYSRATIQGVAGSGKTVLAIAKARAFADEGKRVLFLCFNEMLAEWQRDLLPEKYRTSVIIRNYHQLCSEWVKRAKLAWPAVVNEDAFFSETAPLLLEQAIDILGHELFDAVVVDEGQDFQQKWWDTVELLNKEPMEGPLYIFFDPHQQIFDNAKAAMPDLGKPFILPTNCRNTGKIAGLCGKVIDKEIPVNDGTPKGTEPKFVFASSDAEQLQATEAQVTAWAAQPGGLKTSQIVVATRGKLETSFLAKTKQLAGQLVTRDLKTWRSGGGILVTNLYKFKGLEAEALVLVDMVPPNALPYFTPQHYYVACSRAKHLLTIVSRTEKRGF